MTEKTEKNLVVQHNKIIEAKYRLSIGEQRLIKVLVSMIEPEDEDFKSYKIPVSDLVKILNISDGDFYGKVKLWSKKLISNVLVFRGENEEELQVAWLSSAIYKPKSGVVELEFSPKLKPFLLHLKSHFTAYELGNIIRLKHIYSIRIYELLKQYEKIGQRRLTISSLRELLMLEDHEYKQFSDFRKRVLLESQKELLEKTDIAFSWKEEKQKQRCVAIEFIITSQERKNREIKSVQEDIKIDKFTVNNNVIEQLIGFGVTNITAQKIAQDHDEKRIETAIAYTESQLKLGKVKNPGGFIVEAIKNEYRDSQAEEQEKKQKVRKQKEDKEKRDKELEKQQNLHNKAAIENYLNSLTKEQFLELEAEFLEAYKNDACVMKKYHKERFKNPTVKGCFGAFVLKKVSQLKEANS